MKKRLKIALFSPLLLLLFFIVLFELGFWLRERVFLAQQDKDSSGNTRIIFAGDSVLGSMEQRGTLAHALKSELNRRHPGRYDFREISLGSLTTLQALPLLDELVKEFNPHAVILLLGKTDIKRRGEYHSDWISRIRFLRFLELNLWAVMRDIKQLIFFSVYKDLEIGWQHLKAQRFAEASPYFYKAAQVLDDDRFITALHHSYYKSARHEEAISSFRELFPRSVHQPLLTDLIAIHERSLKGAISAEELFERRKFSGKSRNFIKTSLWFYRAAKRTDLYQQEYLEMPRESSDQLTQRSCDYFKGILELLARIQARPFVIQYPLDHLEVLKSCLGSYSAAYLDVRSIFSSLEAKKLMNMLSEDMEHLSAEGSHFLSLQLADMIEAEVKKP